MWAGRGDEYGDVGGSGNHPTMTFTNGAAPPLLFGMCVTYLKLRMSGIKLITFTCGSFGPCSDKRGFPLTQCGAQLRQKSAFRAA